MLVMTHSGNFHADDVLAWGLLSTFLTEELELIRTRDKSLLAQGDLIFDVGGHYDPSKGQFDHHQAEYQGPLSSAGMILLWLFNNQHLSEELYLLLRSEIVDYVDAVDNGALLPEAGSGSFPIIVDYYNKGCTSLAAFDQAFQRAADVALGLIKGIVLSFNEEMKAFKDVKKALEISEREQSNLLFFRQYLPWKGPYFDITEGTHPTEFVIFSSLQGTWQAIAIPPEKNSFAQKVPFPASWAGKRGAELAEITGYASAEFCHKNRFIAVFHDLRELLEAMEKFNLLRNINIESLIQQIQS
jgi:uncharacterized UPF0160 family protein